SRGRFGSVHSPYVQSTCVICMHSMSAYNEPLNCGLHVACISSTRTQTERGEFAVSRGVAGGEECVGFELVVSSAEVVEVGGVGGAVGPGGVVVEVALGRGCAAGGELAGAVAPGDGFA